MLVLTKIIYCKIQTTINT